MPIKPDILSAIAKRLADAPSRGRGAMMQAEAARLAMSSATLYRELRALRGPGRQSPDEVGSGRLKRRDSGKLRRASEAHVRAVATVKAKARDTLNGRELPSDIAITIAEENGAIPTGALNRRTYDRVARELGLHGPAKIFIRYQAAASNILHHVDSSGSKYLRVVGATPEGDIEIAVRPPKYRRVRQEEPVGLWCTSVVDDHSRVIFMFYAIGAGESALMVIEALRRAWSAHPDCAIRGLPRKLMCDYGPFKKSQEGMNFLESVGVETADVMPNNPAAHGKIERPWHTWIRRFELPFLAAPELRLTLTELNARLASYAAEQNARMHPRFLDRTREAVYAAGLDAAAVRYLPEDIGAMIFRDDFRRVGLDATIRWRNAWYLVADKLAGRTVRVVSSADGALVVESEGESFPAKPFSPVEFGTFRAHAITPAARLTQEAQDKSYRLPEPTASNVVRLPLGRAAEIDSPLSRVEGDAEFVNQEEALRFIAVETGRAIHQWPPDVLVEIRRLVEGTLNKETLRNAAAELRTLVG